METNMVLSLSTTSPSGPSEIVAASDLTALTIAHLLVEKIISCHGMCAELLSDRGTASQAFKTKAMSVCGGMGVHKVNTTAYHP